ncbi:MAG: VIT1/CCC1 transporter family protein [Patescibacteria group bacterium]
MAQIRSISTTYFRNFIFGVEDSLVSTVGLLSGVAIADVERSTIILTGVVLIFVEAISMAAGSFLSETSAQNYATQHEQPLRSSVASGAIMFFSYFLAGFIPLLPYLLLGTAMAFPASIGASLCALFCLGIVSARLSKTSISRNVLRMVIVGGLAIAVGVIVGSMITNGGLGSIE